MGWDDSFVSILTIPSGATSGRRIVINGVTGEILVYDENDVIIAKVSPDISEDGQHPGGFWTRDFSFPDPIFGELTGGVLSWNSLTNQANQAGSISWVDNAGVNQTYMVLSSGAYRLTDEPAWITLESTSNTRTVPRVIISDNGAGRCDLDVSGDFILDNIDQGRGLVGWIAKRTNTLGLVAEALIATTTTFDFVNNRAYEVEIKGLVSSTIASDRVTVRARRTGVAGAIAIDSMASFTIPAINANVIFSLKATVVNVTGADITNTVMCLTALRSAGTGTVGVTADATNPASVTVRDIGLAVDYPLAREIS